MIINLSLRPVVQIDVFLPAAILKRNLWQTVDLCAVRILGNAVSTAFRPFTFLEI